jgi:hypothetical protein
MIYLVCIAVGWALAHVSAARWQWLEAKIKTAIDRITAGKKVL